MTSEQTDVTVSSAFSGLDITFGGDRAHGGILIRSIEALERDSSRVSGPSLVVDTILKHCYATSVAGLVEEMPSLKCSDARSPLCLVERGSWSPPWDSGQLFSTPRVGLSLKTYTDHARSPLGFIMRRLDSSAKFIHVNGIISSACSNPEKDHYPYCVVQVPLSQRAEKK